MCEEEEDEGEDTKVGTSNAVLHCRRRRVGRGLQPSFPPPTPPPQVCLYAKGSSSDY